MVTCAGIFRGNSGVIPRCTGYRQLLDSFQTFVEDPKTCNKKSVCKMAGIKDIEDLGKLKIDTTFKSEVNGVTWYNPQSLAQVYQLLVFFCFQVEN